MGFAISTSWNAGRFREGNGIINEIVEAGFSEVELSFNLTEKIVKDILRLTRQKKIKVVSLHNYCPIPRGLAREIALPDVYSISSRNEEERKFAVSATKRSIDYCARFGAQALVLHCGYAELQDNTRSLIDLYRNGLNKNRQFYAVKDRMQKERQEKKDIYLARVIKSLEQLVRYAERMGVSLGIENRFYVREIPDFDEIGAILKHFANDTIFYWHDTGHAQIMENLGFINSAYDYLTEYGVKLSGMHLHDVKNCRDHLAPSGENLDFSLLKPYINSSVIKVIEAHHPATKEEIIKARLYLKKVLG